MMAKSIFALVASLLLIKAAYSQTDFKSEDELKSKAQELFNERKLAEASPLYAQLLSLYPQDPNYNYKYGATLLEASADREKPLKYLKFAISKSSQVEPLAFYFLGKAHHLNYNFADAVKYYSRFKQKGSSDLQEEFMVDRQIEMAKNGNQLLSKLNEVQVLDKQTINRKDFFRIYELDGIDGKIIVKPSDFMTKYDQKVGEKSVIYLPNQASEVYFSSYGKKGENGRDIYKTVKLGNRSWSEPVNLGPSINTPYDENYPFIHPDGRTLYFASKGHSSMGGYDLFVSTYDESTAQWKAPVNLDFAFSSVDDDILFVTDKNKVLAYFASSRANEADEVTVYKVMVDKAPADLSVIKGKFIAESNPDLKKAKITVIDTKSQETIGIYETDDKGNYQIEIGTNGGLYRFNVETTADDPIHTGEVEIPHQEVFEVLGQELRLVGSGDAQQLVIKNIFDGTLAQSGGSGPKISSATLKQKALLDINFSEEALAEMRRNGTISSGDEQASGAQSTTSGTQTSSDDQLAATESNPASQSNDGSNSSANNNTNTSSSGGGVNPASGGGGVDPASAAAAGALTAGALTASSSGANKEELNSDFTQLGNDINSRSNEMSAETAYAYKQAADLKSQADEAFRNLGVDPKNDELPASSSLNTDPKAQEARELASKAAIRAALAQRMEGASSQMNDLKSSYDTQSSTINTQLSEGQLNDAEQSISSLTNQLNSSRSNEEYLDNYNNLLAAAITQESEELTTEKEKLKGLEKEQGRLDSSIQSVQVSADGTPEERANQLEQLKLDSADIAFQLNASNRKISDKEKEVAALNLERTEVMAMKDELATVDASSSTEPTVSQEDKDQMINDLKAYRDNNQLAYASPEGNADQLNFPSEAYLGTEFSQSLAATTSASTSISSGAEAQPTSTSFEEYASVSIRSLDDIENEHALALNETSSIADADLQNARKLEIYDEWDADLDQQIGRRRADLAKASDPVEKKRLQGEINEFTREAASRNADKEAIRASMSAATLAAAGTSGQNANPQAASDQAGSNNNTVSDNATTSSSNQAQQNSNSGSTSSSPSAAELAAAVEPSSISDVTASSPYPTGLTAFNFDKSYNYSSAEVNSSLKDVKTTLYQARDYSEKADAARSAAYTLPTVEERRQAFEDVNKYEESSAVLQLEAMKKVGVVNQQEYFRNANILNNLNEYDDSEIESNNLDMANLLNDEAQTYFNNAQVIRSEATAEGSTEKNTRTKLQKAYDMELLALSKQRKALESLKLVDSEVSTLASQDGSSLQQIRNANIQTITDPKVLEIEDAAVAKGEGDQLIKTAEVLELEATAIKDTAETMQIGAERDSLMAIYQAKSDSAVQIRSEAAVYYEREKQINEGFVADVAIDEGILRPALVFTQSYDLDTVQVDEERRNTIMASQEYTTFMTAAKENQQLRLAAQVEYDKALELRKRQIALDKEAQVILASAAQTDDAVEKERRVKQARVIELKAQRIDESIDSLNKIIRVKNYLVTSSEDKMKNSLAALNATQQAEIIYLVNQEVDITSTNQQYAASTAATSLAAGEIASKTPTVTTSTDAGSISTPPSNTATDLAANNPSANTTTSTQPTSSSSGNRATPPSRTNTETRNVEEGETLSDGTVNPNEIIRSAPRRPVSLSSIDRVPRTMDQPIFIKLGITESAYDENKPIPVMPELPEGLVYKVQVGAFRNPIPQDLFKGFAPLTSEAGPNGITRYTAGLFTAEREAVSARDEIRDFGYKDAFVVVFRNGERVSIAAARNAIISGDTGSSTLSTSSNTSSTNNSSSNISGGSSESTPSRPSTSNVEFPGDVTNAADVDDLFFSVQIGVYSKEVKAGTFDAYNDVNAIQLPSGLIRYNAGMFDSVSEAEAYKNEITSNISDAFVVAYYQGRRISINEAARLLNQN